MKEVKPSELKMYIGHGISMRKDDDWVFVGELVNVKDWPNIGLSMSIKIKRDDMWDGIEPWFAIPSENEKILIHE